MTKIGASVRHEVLLSGISHSVPTSDTVQARNPRSMGGQNCFFGTGNKKSHVVARKLVIKMEHNPRVLIPIVQFQDVPRPHLIGVDHTETLHGTAISAAPLGWLTGGQWGSPMAVPCVVSGIQKHYETTTKD